MQSFYNRAREKLFPGVRARNEDVRHTIRKNTNYPILLPEQRLGVFWSAKAGCSFAAKWCFFQLGQLEQAREYSPKIHQYRIKVYRPSDTFRSALEDAPNYTYIRVCRNPYSRAVSSFLHFIRTPGADSFHAPINEYLGRNIDDLPGLSFSEFVDFLSSINLNRCDIHYRRQSHPILRKGLVKISDIVHLESAFDDIRAIEKKYGLKEAPLDELFTSHHHTVRNQEQGFVGEKRYIYKKGEAFPSYKCFYNQELRDKVFALYEQDFIQYGYSSDL